MTITESDHINAAADHARLVARLAKQPAVIYPTIAQPHNINFLHGAIGVATEAGELLDAAKKAIIHGRPLDIDNIIEELGDIEFYLQLVRSCFGITRTEVLDANFEKLNRRYPANQYSDADAARRADKTEPIGD